MARVLIVDDTEIVRKALELVIRRMGHAGRTASDGLAAWELALEDPPDLALVDLQMPGLDGAELFRRLRGLGERCPKVVFVSATPPEEVARRVEPIGRPDGHVTKPFHLDELMRVVTEALSPRATHASQSVCHGPGGVQEARPVAGAACSG
jgi:two-component system, OmpR family, response regulator